MKVFSDERHALINNFVFRGSVVIIVNEDAGKYFLTKKGLGQGDPLSQILFNIVADMQLILIEQTKFDGRFKEWFSIWLMEDCLFFNMPMT
jgi:hypothetical protein